jgi:hypothetical protein
MIELKNVLYKIRKIYIDYWGEDVAEVLLCSYEIALCSEELEEYQNVIEISND